MSRLLALPFVLPALLCAALGTLAGLATWEIATGTAAERLERSLLLAGRGVEAGVERFRPLPSVMLEDPRIRAAIAGPDDPARIAAANGALEVAARRAGADQLYLMDAGGTTIAASNWAEENTFLGQNYAFRPYFTEALETGVGRFYAVGVTTGEPGYFLSTRAEVAGRTAVMVVKVDLRHLPQDWARTGVTLALADRHGIVILSGDPDWLYRPLRPLDADRAEAILGTRAYAGIPVTRSAPLTGTGGTVGGPGGESMLRALVLPVDDWQLLAAAPLAPAWRLAWGAAAVGALAGLMLSALLRVRLQRQRLLQMRLRQGELLERRVAERTEALGREIEERRQAEADLRAAQDALVQSEKMAALGRMSAAIVHEISQPLAAMEASLAAALLSGGIETDAARGRVEKARAHIRRMLRTIKHLKSFSRKEAVAARPVTVDDAIRSALEIAGLRATDGAAIVFRPAGPSPVAMAGQVRLEQVLVNLLSNALDAVADRPDGRIEVTRHEAGGRVTITVTDNGPGIPRALLARIGEPFFSTKSGGESLGLGLSISRTIVEEFGGAFEIGPAPGGGTRARIALDALGTSGRTDGIAAE
ncbi:sensor histidine kinase [Wenxinia marina]|uniref:histidine kinase n=1 Tax=Wenxinia marina DSM 24838 TaxID=1123501 RepID=A0A0D0NL91_9RHOB|nr:ATP-binding protein [Wenxinia marina]KIQ69075.1 Signal transduction histidine kinase regulating C4-dicarboxylate transport system [Wenxinia marina DSM 24838]GGL70131.1 sensor histidine kinase [Wenxinia marina]